jgi:GNAT superfamily N-acetyltransferase
VHEAGPTGAAGDRAVVERVVLRDGSVAALRAVPYADPVAHALVEAVQGEYVARYGGRDEAVVDPAEFQPPGGLFLVATVDGEPAGCGGWRVHDERVHDERVHDGEPAGGSGPRPGAVEVKRVYVVPAFRRRGLARVLLDALEASAAAAGYGAVVLNSGDQQPEALGLYRAAGYTAVPGYGVYADAPGAVFLGRALTRPGRATEHREETEVRPWAS